MHALDAGVPVEGDERLHGARTPPASFDPRHPVVTTEYLGPFPQLDLQRLVLDESKPLVARLVCLLLRLQLAFELDQLGFAALLAGDAERFDLGASV